MLVSLSAEQLAALDREQPVRLLQSHRRWRLLPASELCVRPFSMYIVIGIIAFLFVLQAVTARLEKRMIWPYGSPETQPQFPDSTGYSARWIDDALKVGFSFLGWSPDLKGPRYRVCYALLVSPERDCFVIIGVGTILSMTLRGTWIYTRATDGRVFYTTDNQACVEIDVARQWRSQLVRTGTFADLLRRHRDLLRDCGVTPQPFTAGREVQEFKNCREERYQSMSRKGLIAFTDSSATHWRYTFWGSVKLAALNYSIGLLRGVTYGRIPKSA
jgi:hypothetical protein